MAAVTWKWTRVARKSRPSTVHKPNVVVTVKTPAIKLKALGIGDLRRSRLSKMTAETTPTFRTFIESITANPASASTRAAMTVV
jgi:hypothetical protein